VITNTSSFGFTQLLTSVGFLAFTSSHADSDVDESEHFTFFWLSDSPLSQWYSCRFTVDETEYNCAEQFMMQQKACESHFSVVCYYFFAFDSW